MTRQAAGPPRLTCLTCPCAHRPTEASTHPPSAAFPSSLLTPTMSASTLSIVEQARLRRSASAGQSLPKVLFVDDEERILRVLTSLFRPHYAVSVCTDPTEALALLQREHFHVIVSDQRMPQMEGVELLRQARERSPTTVRLLLTGYADLPAAMASMNEAEVFRYLTKPWLNSELQATLAQAVEAGLAMAPVPDPAPESAGWASRRAATGPAGVASDATPLNPTSMATGERDNVLFLERSGALYRDFLAEPHSDLTLLAAATPDEAIELMQAHEVLVLVVAIDGPDHANIEFLQVLKREHPQVSSIVVSDMGDSATVVGLINLARVFRGTFRPVKTGALKLYIKSALRQAQQFRCNPVALHTQQAVVENHTEAAAAVADRSLGQRLKAIKSFFWRR